MWHTVWCVKARQTSLVEIRAQCTVYVSSNYVSLFSSSSVESQGILSLMPTQGSSLFLPVVLGVVVLPPHNLYYTYASSIRPLDLNWMDVVVKLVGFLCLVSYVAGETYTQYIHTPSCYVQNHPTECYYGCQSSLLWTRLVVSCWTIEDIALSLSPLEICLLVTIDTWCPGAGATNVIVGAFLTWRAGC